MKRTLGQLIHPAGEFFQEKLSESHFHPQPFTLKPFSKASGTCFCSRPDMWIAHPIILHLQQLFFSHVPFCSLHNLLQLFQRIIIQPPPTLTLLPWQRAHPHKTTPPASTSSSSSSPSNRPGIPSPWKRHSAWKCLWERRREKRKVDAFSFLSLLSWICAQHSSSPHTLLFIIIVIIITHLSGCQQPAVTRQHDLTGKEHKQLLLLRSAQKWWILRRTWQTYQDASQEEMIAEVWCE